jgi:hypothetical protein
MCWPDTPPHTSQQRPCPTFIRFGTADDNCQCEYCVDQKCSLSLALGPVSSATGAGGSFQVLRWLRHEGNSWLSSTEGMRLSGSIPSFPQVFMVGCLIKHKDNFSPVLLMREDK